MENDAKTAAHAETLRIQQSCPHFSVDRRGQWAQCEACGAVVDSDELALERSRAWSKRMNCDLEDQ